MNDHTLLGPWIRRFLLEHVVAERNLARNTQHSYRDAVGLVIPFVAKARKKPVDRLDVIDVSADLVRLFLADIETSRHCSIATRNQRLAAIRAFASFVGEHSPIHIEWSGQVRSIPFKKTGKAVVPVMRRPGFATRKTATPNPIRSFVIPRVCRSLRASMLSSIGRLSLTSMTPGSIRPSATRSFSCYLKNTPGYAT